jgi:hypothetical protein
MRHEKWNDAHKSSFYHASKSSLSLPDYLGEVLQGIKAAKNRKKRSTQKPLRIAHLVSQIIDYGHAPTKSLKTLIENVDQERFHTSIFSTEVHRFCAAEYPYHPFYSPPSQDRAPGFLAECQQSGIRVDLQSGTKGYLETTEYLKNELEKAEIDIALFHGNDMLFVLLAKCCDIPVKAFLDYGSLSYYPGFNLLFVSTEQTKKEYSDACKEFDGEIAVVPMVVDVKASWERRPYSKSHFGVDEDAKIMTTVSNHLDDRVSEEMCWAISEILRRCPQSYYMPIGNVKNKMRFFSFFKKRGVANRVRLLGLHPAPSHLSRSMDLYLNEFPFGGGFSLLDAMAAGCPVVTMYDEKGPIQGRVGGIYFSKERAIQSCSTEEYVEQAVALLEDPKLHSEWSAFALKRYKEQVNPKEYVRTIEDRLIKKYYETFESN